MTKLKAKQRAPGHLPSGMLWERWVKGDASFEFTYPASPEVGASWWREQFTGCDPVTMFALRENAHSRARAAITEIANRGYTLKEWAKADDVPLHPFYEVNTGQLKAAMNKFHEDSDILRDAVQERLKIIKRTSSAATLPPSGAAARKINLEGE